MNKNGLLSVGKIENKKKKVQLISTSCTLV